MSQPSSAPISRRHALTLVGAAAAGALAACARTRSDDRAAASAASIARTLGIQLYTVRRAMAADAEGTLAALSAIGYREVELAGLHGMTATAFRAMLDRHQLTAPSGHVGLDALRGDLPRLIDEAKTLGHHWLICPWIDARERTPDGYRRVADDLVAFADVASKSGLRLGYHNHAFEFETLPDGSRGYDILLTRLDDTMVDMELDVFWMTKAGHDPLTYLDLRPKRFPLIHAKDMDAAGKMVDVGQGRIDFRSILSAARGSGIRHVFVEHDEPPSPLESARSSYAALREILDT